MRDDQGTAESSAIESWDPGAFAGFYRRHERAVTAALMRRTGRAEVAADLTSEVFAAALLAWRRGEASVMKNERAWLLGIAEHKVVDSYRRGRVEDRARRELATRPAEPSDRSLAAIEALTAETPALELTETLPAEQRYAVRARVIDERSYAEIADELDLSEQVVRQRVSRGLARLRAALMVAGPVAAVIVAVVFLTTLRHSAGRSLVPRTGPAPALGGSFRGAPRTQPGQWEGGADTCPLEAPNRYLPARSGCVTALRISMTAARTPDLVLLFAHLTHREYAGRYTPTRFTLEVIRPDGQVARTRVPTSISNASIVEYGNINRVPGDELAVQNYRISSGSGGLLYTFHAGRLVRLPVVLGWGGDSGTKAGFACRPGRPPTLVSRSFELDGGGEDGRWQQTTTVYAWHGAILREISHRTSMRHGLPPVSETSLGEGCGTVDRATTS